MAAICLKIAGAIIVMAASTLAGLYVSNLEVYRIEDLLEMKKALTILKSEVEFIRTPLPQAFHNIGLRVKSPMNEIFFFIGGSLEDRSDRLSVLWEKGLRKYGESTFLKPEDLESFIGLGTTLGYLDEKMQIAGIDLVLQYIDGRLEQLQDVSARNKKLYRSLGFLGGMLVVVVLI